MNQVIPFSIKMHPYPPEMPECCTPHGSHHYSFLYIQRSGVGNAQEKNDKCNVLFAVQKNEKRCIASCQMVIL